MLRLSRRGLGYPWRSWWCYGHRPWFQASQPRQNPTALTALHGKTMWEYFSKDHWQLLRPMFPSWQNLGDPSSVRIAHPPSQQCWKWATPPWNRGNVITLSILWYGRVITHRKRGPCGYIFLWLQHWSVEAIVTGPTWMLADNYFKGTVYQPTIRNIQNRHKLRREQDVSPSMIVSSNGILPLDILNKLISACLWTRSSKT